MRQVSTRGKLIARRDWFGTPTRFLARDRSGSNWLEADNDALRHATGLDTQWLADFVKYQVPLTLRTCRPGILNVRTGALVTRSPGSDLPAVKFPALESNKQPQESGIEIIDDRLRTNIATLDPKETIFHLSAGLDSSLLVLLACQIHGSGNIRAITFRALGGDEGKEANVSERLCDDLGVDLTVVDLSNADIWSAARRMIAALQFPAGHASALARFLLDEAALASGAKAVVSGRGADEVLGGYGWHLLGMDGAGHQNRVRATDPNLVAALFPQSDNESDMAYAQFFEASHNLDRRLQYDLATLGSDWQFIEAQIGANMGLTMIAPFADAVVARTAYHLPESCKIASGLQKVALRNHFSTLYPTYILEQPKRGLTFDIGAYLRRLTPQEIINRIGPGWIEGFGPLLNAPILKSMIESTVAGSQSYGWQIWNICLASLLKNSSPANPEPDS